LVLKKSNAGGDHRWGGNGYNNSRGRNRYFEKGGRKDPTGKPMSHALKRPTSIQTHPPVTESDMRKTGESLERIPKENFRERLTAEEKGKEGNNAAQQKKMGEGKKKLHPLRHRTTRGV